MILAGFAPGRAFPALPFAILLSRPKQQIGQSDGWRFTMAGRLWLLLLDGNLPGFRCSGGRRAVLAGVEEQAAAATGPKIALNSGGL
jgi:hypothetical protein